jgi:hypothetical protein
MKIKAECVPENNAWVLIPTVILFVKNKENKSDYTDLTFAWLCFTFSVCFGGIKKA